ncbi:DNA repair protein RecO [Tengunoibacter tsumagoiensis]|uniref:DNA repair protein RecO n=1 Tax=Tengunoibacter tsumagoiensis TaxID=2014871 RepID=A0A402A4Y7_9CHLR|nr:DNA repair protein RecO [Tengunoibacter tsumagoiensis]GCE14075.1 DNA repair protein RecO [Tengunoibacter tsumagoiensis]
MRNQRTYSIEAVVLKHTDLGEADRILTLLTPYKGKIRAVAKGARRPISRKAGHLELLCHSQLQLALGRNLDIITQAQASENYFQLRSNLWYMTCGFYLAELIERFIEDDTPHPEVYHLLLLALRELETEASSEQQKRIGGLALDGREQMHSFLLLRYFEVYLLSHIGYAPVLRHCANCTAELKPEVNGFTPTLGGALCPKCSHLWAQPLSMNALKVLRLLQRTDWPQVPHLRLDTRLQAEIEGAMHGLLRFHLERDLKSWSFLDMLNAR